MPPQPDPLRRFWRGALLSLPGALAFWWFIAVGYLGALLAPLVGWSLSLSVPHLVVELVPVGLDWTLITTLSPIDSPLDLLALQIPPVRFTASFALFWGLVLATPIPWGERGYQLLTGTAFVMMPLVVMMISLFALFRIGLYLNHTPIVGQMPPEQWYLGAPFPGWIYHLLGVGRQLSALVLPMVLPVLAWAAFNGEVINRVLLSRLRQRPETTA